MKICLVMDSLERRRQSHEEIRNIVEQFDVPLVLVDKTFKDESVFDKGPRRKLLEAVKRLLRGRFTVLIALEDAIAARLCERDRQVLERLSWLNERQHIFETVPKLEESEIVYFEPKRVGKERYDFPEDVLEKVRSMCDTIVLEGFCRILTGNVLHVVKNGVISGHGADITRYRGRPHGFFEWIEDQKTVGVTIQRLTDELDGGYVLVCDQGDISDARSWAEVRLELLEMRGDLFVRALRRIEAQDFQLGPKGTGVLHTQRMADRFGATMRCLLKDLRCRLWNCPKVESSWRR